jgi:hypothetical protein
MGRNGVWGARHTPTHQPPLAPSSYDISQPAGRHQPYFTHMHAYSVLHVPPSGRTTRRGPACGLAEQMATDSLSSAAPGGRLSDRHLARSSRTHSDRSGWPGHRVVIMNEMLRPQFATSGPRAWPDAVPHPRIRQPVRPFRFHCLAERILLEGQQTGQWNKRRREEQTAQRQYAAVLSADPELPRTS